MSSPEHRKWLEHQRACGIDLAKSPNAQDDFYAGYYAATDVHVERLAQFWYRSQAGQMCAQASGVPDIEHWRKCAREFLDPIPH